MSEIDDLIEKLKDPENEVRRNTAYRLGDIGDISAVPALIKALEDEDNEIRAVAAWSLGENGDPSAVPALIEALGDEDAEVKLKSVEAILKVGKPAVPALIELLEGGKRRAFAAKALGKIGDSSAVAALIMALEDNDWAVVRESIVALGEIKDKRAVPVLIDALEFGDSAGKNYAIQSLCVIGDTSAVPALIKALGDEESNIRSEASWALGEIGEKNPGSVNLVDVRISLIEFVDRSKDKDIARMDAYIVYAQISEAVKKGRQKIDMPGELFRTTFPKKPRTFRRGISNA